MAKGKLGTPYLLAVLICFATLCATAQSFRVQCPASTITHPTAANNNSQPPYTGPTQFTTGPAGYQVPTTASVHGAIKCQQISGGDGYSTMADGTQTYMFSFGPLSGLYDMSQGLPGTQYPAVFNNVFPGNLKPGDPATTVDAFGPGSFTYNGAVGLIGDENQGYATPGGVTATATATVANGVVDTVTITNPGSGYYGPVFATFSAPGTVVPAIATH